MTFKYPDLIPLSYRLWFLKLATLSKTYSRGAYAVFVTVCLGTRFIVHYNTALLSSGFWLVSAVTWRFLPRKCVQDWSLCNFSITSEGAFGRNLEKLCGVHVHVKICCRPMILPQCYNSGNETWLLKRSGLLNVGKWVTYLCNIGFAYTWTRSS